MTERMRINILALLVLVSAVMPVQAAEREKTPFLPPLFRGVSAHFDLASPIMGLAAGSNVHNYEAMVDVSIYDRFFPCLEVGYTNVSHAVDEKSYKAQSPFFRLGMNMNLLKTVRDGKAQNIRNYAYLGVRYAFAPMTYSIGNIVMSDGYWGGETVIDYPAETVYAGWAEIVGGVRIDFVAGFTMGWSVRIKALMHTSAESKDLLWYVPGFGKNSTTSFSFSYTVGYTFRTPATKKLMNIDKDK